MINALLILFFLIASVGSLICNEHSSLLVPSNDANIVTYQWDFSTSTYIYDTTSLSLSDETAHLIPMSNWYNTDSGYRTSFIVDNTLNSNSILNTQFQLHLDYENFNYLHASPTGSDIRFTDLQGSKLSYWIEKWDPNGSSLIWVEIPFVIFGSTTTIYMFYGNTSAFSLGNGVSVFEGHGFDDFESFNEGSLVGQVPEPSNPWNANSTNPILASGIYNNSMYGFSSIVKDGLIYHMYFTKNTSIGHATSNDGKNWDIDQANNEVLTNAVVPMVWKENNTWYMLYRHKIAQTQYYGIGLATSSNGIFWVRYVNNPVLMENDTSYWFGGIEPWGIIKVDNTYYLFYNDWNDITTKRKTGIAKSTDLYHWVKDTHNPIFDDGRFCSFPFKYGNYFYLLIPHYTSWDDYSVIELYRDVNPTFYPDEREFVKIVSKPGSIGSWNFQDQDTPFVLTDDIHRNTFSLTNNELWMYYAGAPYNYPSTWYTGLTIESNINTALAQVKESPLWTYGLNTAIVVNSPTINSSGNSLAIPCTRGTALSTDIDIKPNGVYQLWMRVTDNEISKFTFDLVDYNNELEASVGFGSNYFQFHDKSKNKYIQTNVPFAHNTWYLVSIEMNNNTYNAVIYNEDYQEIVRYNEIDIAGPIKKLTVSNDAPNGHSWIGFIDNYQVFLKNNEIEQNILSNGIEELEFPTNNPTLCPSQSLTFLSLKGFVEVADKNDGEIKYILSNDEGNTWYYFDGADWVTSNISYDQANTASEINGSLTSFPIGNGHFLWKAFFHTNGGQQISLHSVSLEYSLPTLIAPSNLHFTVLNNNLELSWDSVPGASYYKIYEAESMEGPWIQTITSSSNFMNRPILNLTSRKFFRITAFIAP